MKNTLVTGGAGLIGSHLCDFLVEKGYKVTCVDNFITGRPDNVAQLASCKKFRFIKADASMPLKKIFTKKERFDFIFHLASPASPRGYMDHPVETYRVNSFGTERLLGFAKEQKARFLFASTSEIYGNPKVHPQPESYWGNVNPNGIRACYDESKRFGEMVCKVFEREYKMDIRIARIFNTYGPRNDPEDGRVVPNFITQALKGEPITVYGDGKQTRSFCYVSDMVEGIYKLMFKNSAKGQVVNIGNPDEFSILEFAKIIKKAAQSESKIVFTDLPEDDPERRKPKISLAKKLLDWEPKVDLEKGLPPTIEYFKKILKEKPKKSGQKKH